MAQNNSRYSRPVFLVDGSRTPFLKARGRPGPFKHADLGIHAARSVLLRMPFEPDAFDEVIFGATMPGPDEANLARVVALRLGCGDRVPAYTVQRNCASGMQALDNAALSIASGRSELVLAARGHGPVRARQSPETRPGSKKRRAVRGRAAVRCARQYLRCRRWGTSRHDTGEARASAPGLRQTLRPGHTG